jgi:hypothetical protein
MANTFAETAIKFVVDGGAFKGQLAGIERAVGEAAGRIASTVKTAMLGLGAAVAGGVGTMAVLTKLSADAGDELAKMSQRVAISVETLSGYKLAADLAGTSLEDFGTSLQRASRNIVEAAQGTGAAADAFDTLGIRVTDNAGKLKTAEQIMLEVADQFAQMEDGAQKTALAMDIFGKSGASMIPLLNQGSAAIAAQRKEAEQLGTTWTTAQAKMGEDFNDNVERIQAGLAGFRNAVAAGLLPFFNEMVAGIVAKLKELGESGELKAWAKATSDAIINAIVAIAQFIDAHLIQSVEAGTRAFVAMEIAARGIANGVLVITNGVLALAWAINAGGLAVRKFLGIEESLGVTTQEVEARVDRITTQMAENSQRIVEMSEGLNRALTTFQTPLSDEARGRLSSFAAGVSRIALNVQAWAEKAKAGGAEAVKAIGENVAKSGQLVLKSAKEQVKELEEAFKAASTRGEASLYDVRDYMERRAELFRAGSKERIQAEAEAFKYAKEMADQLFAHQKALGLKSLEDEIAHLKQKAAAAKQGSAEQMKAEEDVFKKEEELRNKRQAAALGILGEVKERLEAKGYTEGDLITRDMVEREMFDLQAERGRAAAKAQRFAAGGGETLGDVVAGYQAAGKLTQDQAQQRELGGVGEILAGGAQVGAGPLTKALGGLGDAITTPDYWEKAGTGMAEGYGRAMEDAYASVDAGLSKIEERVNVSSSRTAQTIYSNLEEYLVRRIMGQLDRN